MKNKIALLGILAWCICLTWCDDPNLINEGDTITISYQYSCKGEIFDQGEKEEIITTDSIFYHQPLEITLTGNRNPLEAQYDKEKLRIFPLEYLTENKEYKMNDDASVPGIGTGRVVESKEEYDTIRYTLDFNPCQTYQSFQFTEEVIKVTKK